MRPRLLLIGPAFLLALAACAPTPRVKVAAPGQPRLAVLVWFDQFRGDYLGRWEDLFIEDGFRRLMTDGAWFQDCHYPYANTETGPGHASVATGCAPDKHGIVANDWYDRATGDTLYCGGTPRYRSVPPVPYEDRDKDGKALKPRSFGGPDRLLAPTLADALKKATGGKGKVMALSFKDRSAVLPGGKQPDACYWIDNTVGLAVTSTYYRDAVHPWVAEFNRRKPADTWFGKDWERLRPDLDYARRSGPDDVVGEGNGTKQGRTFPHPMTGGLKEPGKDYYQALYTSPFGNDLLLDLVKRAIDAEQLGADDVPDLLCVSFSCNDPVGHAWGPDSQEVLDVTLRSDRVVKGLLDHLDAAVGKGNYVLALTSDHGVCPMPEVARGRGIEADRILPAELAKNAEAFLQERFGGGDARARWIEPDFPWLFLNRALARAKGLDAAKVEDELAGWLSRQPGVLAAHTRSRLLRGVPEDDAVGRRVLRTFHPQRCGDVAVVVKPYSQITSYLTGTGHGTPHEYDTHVPLLVYGPGVAAGPRRDAVTPLAAPVILAHALGIDPPAAAEVPVPEGLFAAPR